MASNDVKWIKIVTDIFDDEKMLFIEQLPEADSIIVIWFKLLTLSGKVNNGGVLIFNETMAYTDEMLATLFRRNINTVRLALETFKKFGMIDIIEDTITIPNWSKHQSLEQLEERKEYMRNYMRDYREKQKQLALGECKINSKVNSKSNGKANVNALEEEREVDIDIDKKNKKSKKHKYGEYQNVLLSDQELEKLKKEFPQDWKDRIDRLSGYCESTGKSYKNYLVTIRNWAKREEKDKPKTNKPEYVHVPEEFRT